MEQTKIDILIEEIKKSNVVLEDMAKDIKSMKTFMHILTNKLGGML